jgi:hypothetical protein
MTAGVSSMVRHVVGSLSARTGLPMIVIALLGLVLAWRMAVRTWHVVLEVALAVGLLFAATRFGWIRW